AFERTWQAALTVPELHAESIVAQAARTSGLLTDAALAGPWDLVDRSGGGHDWSAAGTPSSTMGPLQSSTQSVVVTVDGLVSNGVTFAVRLPPQILSISPSSGAVGSVVTIQGVHFGATQGGSTVAFDGSAASGVVTRWSDTSIEF